ncbi:MAG: pyruvate dehydrogenase (acetyl-transferring) E1 component subunit alpha [Opitutales bacterium]|nr:pyruvate dehydrogenase (acetyl-transferring) E1 component subunit alpha [Opitutales bacterium]
MTSNKSKNTGKASASKTPSPEKRTAATKAATSGGKKKAASPKAQRPEKSKRVSERSPEFSKAARTEVLEHNKTYVKDPVNASLSKEDKIHLYREMIRIRRFEERTLRVYQQGKVGGFLHLYIGQEAIAVACASVMEANDHVITAYRDHGIGLAVGMSMNECMAELQGKFTGCSKGKGGSMHYFAPDKRYWGGHGIVAGQTPLGLGLAFALKYQEIKGCCVCMLGEGAVNQGVFHESLNLASLWRIPVVYLIENNGYSMGTSQARSSAGAILAQRAEAYEMGWDHGNGNSIYEVRAKLAKAMKDARDNQRPSIVEFMTYRYRGHSMSDPDKSYRTKEEIENYKKNKDPITLFEVTLREEGILDDEAIKSIHADATAEAERSAQFADMSPFPPPEELMTDVYWESDHPKQRQSQGSLFFETV